MLMICGEYVETMLIFAQYSIHILSNQQLVTSTIIPSLAHKILKETVFDEISAKLPFVFKNLPYINWNFPNAHK